MTIPNHLALGLIIGKVTGQYEVAIATSLLIDCDHFVSLHKHGVLKSWKLFWETSTNEKDPWGDQRGVLHTFLSVFIVGIVSYLLFSFSLFSALMLSHFGHIFLDLFSRSNSFPFRPFSSIRIKGLIPYYSRYEVLFFLLLMCIFYFL